MRLIAHEGTAIKPREPARTDPGSLIGQAELAS
jgi:hypothetical protein